MSAELQKIPSSRLILKSPKASRLSERQLCHASRLLFYLFLGENPGQQRCWLQDVYLSASAMANRLAIAVSSQLSRFLCFSSHSELKISFYPVSSVLSSPSKLLSARLCFFPLLLPLQKACSLPGRSCLVPGQLCSLRLAVALAPSASRGVCWYLLADQPPDPHSTLDTTCLFIFCVEVTVQKKKVHKMCCGSEFPLMGPTSLYLLGFASLHDISCLKKRCLS